MLKKASLCAIVLGLLCASAYAQSWPTPNYTTPDTPVNCAQCQAGALNLPTPGWHDPVVRYVGRFVSSEYVADFQQGYRTARAKGVVFSPDGSRIAVKLGQGIATYDTASFMTRLDAHEALSPVSILGVNACQRTVTADCSTGAFETFLNFERYFYPENGASGWTIALSDGQDRLGLFDLDDRGLVYAGYDQYGWGVASDLPNTLAGGKLMSSWQDKSSYSNWAPANAAYWIKDGDTYYALAASTTSQTTTHLFKVQTYATVTEIPGPPPAPKQTPPGFFPKLILSLARGNNGRTAIITDSYHLYVYDNHSLVTGGAPLQSFDFTGVATISNVVSDGSNFWVSGLSFSNGVHMMLTRIAPSGLTSYTRTDTVTPYGAAEPGSLQSKDGYLTAVTTDNDGFNIRMYKVSTGNLVELPTVSSISDYFKNLSGYAQHAPHMTIWSATPLVYGGKLYLIVNGDGLGDVYQIRTDDTVNVSFQGTMGPANANAPAKQPTDVFYGDAVKMTAALSSGLTGGAVNWNFGAPHDPANTLAGTFGSQIVHQYSGLSKTDVAAPVNIVATNAANGVTGTTPLTLKTGTARVKYGSTTGPKYLLGSGVPIVNDDSFYDASDGDTAGHYTEWRIGADAATIASPSFTPQLATPTTAVSVAGCGQHTLSMTAHYGYSNYAAANVDFPVSIASPFTYLAQALVPGVDVSYNSATGNEEFVSTSRAAASLAGRTFSYTWDVVDANGTAVITIPPQSGTATSVDTIAKYPVAKSLFTQAGYKGRLTLSASGVDPCSLAGAAFQPQQATSQALVPPDAQLTAVCNNPTNGVCQYSITSPSNVMQSDAWTFAWTATGGNPAGGNSSSLTVSYYTAGTFSVSVVVTNKAGLSKTLPYSASITTPASQCPTFSSVLTNGQTLAGITYKGTSGTSTCVEPSTCQPNENIEFSVFFYPRTPDDSCLSTLTYQWQVDGTGAGTGTSLTTSFGAGTHTVALTLGAGSQSVQLTKSVTIATITPPTPPTPPQPSCATLTGLNTLLNVQGSSVGCTANGTCSSTEVVNFNVSFFNYNSACATHTYAWTFDGVPGSVFTTPNNTHVFSTAGQHTYSVKVSNGTTNVTISGSLTVTGGPPTPPVQSCVPLVNGVNTFLDYTGGTSGCHSGVSCTPGEQITASITFWNYSPSCGNHTYSWTLDDEPVGSTDQSATFTATPGTHTLKVTINNGNPNVTFTQSVVVGPPATANYTFDFSIVPLSFPQFSYAFSVVVTPDTPSKPTQWKWNYGDGSPVTTAGKDQVHTFPDDKEYTVTVTAIDGVGGIVSHTIQTPPSKRRGVRH